MIFETHCHTNHSKGTKIPTEVMMSPKEVVRLAKKKGIDGLAITDHKVTTAWSEAKREAKKQGIILMPGQEVESSDGHILGIGLTESVKNMLSAEETVELIREQGGISIAPHPYDIKNDGLKEKALKADAVEVFNSFVLDRVSNWYAMRKFSKSGMPLVVGSDCHMPQMMGLSVNVADAHSMDGFFREVKWGRVGFRTSYVPIGDVVNWTRDRMTHSYDDIIKYIEKNYSRPKAYVSRSMMRRFVGSRSMGWNVLGGFGISIAVLYSGAKMLTY